MFSSYRIAFWTAALALIVLAGGCSSRAPQEGNATGPEKKGVQEKTAAPDKQADHAAHDGGEHAEAASAGGASGLAELSAEDRAVAEKQRVCPVSGDVLGAHGKPIKVTVKGQAVFICCAACEKPLLENPDKYLAKLQADKPK